MSTIIRPIVSLAVGLSVIFGTGASAFAHIDPDPKNAPAGSEQSVGFTVQHGCERSPTIQLDMRLPDGTTKPVPEAPAGWTATVADNVVTFVGGPLPDDVEETFRVRMVLPTTAGSPIYFPFVQRCEKGEIRWIDVPSDGSAGELDEPAPAMKLTASVATATTAPTPPSPAAVPTSSTPSTPTSATAAATAPPTAEAASSPATSAPTGSTRPDSTTNDNGGSSGLAGTLVFIATMAAIAFMAGLAYWQARRRRSS